MSSPPEANETAPAWAVMSPKRRAHVERVASLMAGWADRLGLDPAERSRWLRAAWLHDALRDADDDTLRAAAGSFGPSLSVDLLHGPAAADRAALEGETDRAVLDAVRYHSVGHPDWAPAGRALYCADFLDPGRRFDREERAALAERFPADPAGVFREVVQRRMWYLVRSGWPIPEPTFRLWNSLADY